MAYDFPLPDIERARTIIDELGAMVVGEPCPACSGHGSRTRVDARTATSERVDCQTCAGFGVAGGVTQAQDETIAALFEGDRSVFELLDERPGHWAIAGSGPDATRTPADASGTGSCARRATRVGASSSTSRRTPAEAKWGRGDERARRDQTRRRRGARAARLRRPRPLRAALLPLPR